jgi:hypothetical protein
MSDGSIPKKVYKQEFWTVAELQDRLIRADRVAYDVMAPMLYFLRIELGRPGRKGEGFGAWAAENLKITRRTADRWALAWGIAEGLIQPVATTDFKGDDEPQDTVSEGEEEFVAHFEMVLGKARYDLFMAAVKSLTKPENTEVVYAAVIAAAEFKKAASVPVAQAATVATERKQLLFLNEGNGDGE